MQVNFALRAVPGHPSIESFGEVLAVRVVLDLQKASTSTEGICAARTQPRER